MRLDLVSNLIERGIVLVRHPSKQDVNDTIDAGIPDDRDVVHTRSFIFLFCFV